MTKVMTIVGTRPEIIRLCRVMARLDATVDHVLVHTGQKGAGERRGGLSLLVRDDWTGDDRDPATLSGGWTGGAMGNLDGVDGYPEGKSIYAVSKGKIAIIAISNQAQSIKGRQMVGDIVTALHL